MAAYHHYYTDEAETRLFDPLVQALMIELGLAPLGPNGRPILPDNPEELRQAQRKWRKQKRKLVNQLRTLRDRYQFKGQAPAYSRLLRDMFVAACQHTLKQRLGELSTGLPQTTQVSWHVSMPAMKNDELPAQLMQAVDKILARYGMNGDDEDGRRQDSHAGRHPRGARYERATKARARARTR